MPKDSRLPVELLRLPVANVNSFTYHRDFADSLASAKNPDHMQKGLKTKRNKTNKRLTDSVFFKACEVTQCMTWFGYRISMHT